MANKRTILIPNYVPNVLKTSLLSLCLKRVVSHDPQPRIDVLFSSLFICRLLRGLLSKRSTSLLALAGRMAAVSVISHPLATFPVSVLKTHPSVYVLPISLRLSQLLSMPHPRESSRGCLSFGLPLNLMGRPQMETFPAPRAWRCDG